MRRLSLRLPEQSLLRVMIKESHAKAQRRKERKGVVRNRIGFFLFFFNYKNKKRMKEEARLESHAQSFAPSRLCERTFFIEFNEKEKK
jgi:hypothetical protein